MTSLPLALALLTALSPLLSSVAVSETVRAEYAVTIRSFPVGSAKLSAEIAKGAYTIAFSGGVRGLARLFSDAQTTASASGRIGGDRLEPQSYSHVWTEDNEVETVAMRFAGRGVTKIALDPPHKPPERYVPLTAETNADALDPVSAFLWPVADFGPGLCERTLPLVDGKRRFDIAFAFARTEPFATREGAFSAKAVVCTFRYRAVAGQRIGGKRDESVTDSNDAEVWMAPVGGGLAAPVRIQFRTRAGRIVLRATTVSVE